MTALGRWFRPPRHVPALFLGVTGSLWLAMGWLAWQLVAQDRALAAQRTQERLDNAAERAVATLRSELADLGQRLETLSRLAPGAVSSELAGQASTLGDDAVLVVAGDRTFDVAPARRLVYYPPFALQRHLPDLPTATFAEAETLEFERRDLAGALRALEPLAAGNDPRVRAGALLRAARIWPQLGRNDRALEAYGSLERLDATSVEGLPASLVARYGRCLVFQRAGRRQDLDSEGKALDLALARGAWRLSRAEYEFYRAEARRWRPPRAEPRPDASTVEGERLSAAVSAAWDAWGVHDAGVASRAGARLVHVDDVGVLVAWHGTGARTAALAAGPRFIDTRLAGPAHAALARYRARLVLAGAEAGDAAVGREPNVAAQLVRPAGDTRLPWSVLIVDTAPGAELTAAGGRRRLVLTGLVALGLFVLLGSAFIVRAVHRELEVSRLQTDFVAAVSHEFRTPLTSIRQVSELLLEGRVPEGRREDYYRMQHRDSERLQRLVESLLDFRRMESGAREYRMETADVTTLVREVATEFSADVAAAGYRVETDLRSEGALVSADREAVVRAIWNLLDNAVKYSPSQKTVWLSSVVADRRVEISVRDHGMGVAPEDQRRIFDKFARGASAVATGAKGTGLGLAMVRHTVTSHGGSVGVESTPGAGSTFTITLPLLDAARAGGPDATHPDRRG